MPALKEKTQQENEHEFDTDDLFSSDSSKDEDFELNMDSARFRGKKGQAGTRSR